MKVCVIGAGLFGCIIARHLMAQGHSVSIIDKRAELSGSIPAACLMKPGWLSKVPQLGRCLEMLDTYYGVKDIEFTVNGLAKATVHWVDPRRVLGVGNVYEMDVEEVLDVGDRVVIATKRERFELDHVVVAAGIWTPRLCPWVQVQPRWGTAFLWPEHSESHVPPFIQQWAPYRQIVAFQRGDGLWAGDGSALVNIDSDRELQMLRRCQGALDIHDAPTYMRGARPYSSNSDGAPCLLERRGRVTVATGGAKNGTAAGAWCALKIGEYLA